MAVVETVWHDNPESLVNENPEEAIANLENELAGMDSLDFDPSQLPDDFWTGEGTTMGNFMDNPDHWLYKDNWRMSSGMDNATSVSYFMHQWIGEDGKRYAAKITWDEERGQLKEERMDERLFRWTPPDEHKRTHRDDDVFAAATGKEFGGGSGSGWYTEAEIKNAWDEGDLKQMEDQGVTWSSYWDYMVGFDDLYNSGELDLDNPSSWMQNETYAGLIDGLGIETQFGSDAGDVYNFNGFGYSRDYWSEKSEALPIINALGAAAIGWAAGPLLAGGLGFTGGVAGGVANGVIGSAIGQGITTGKLDPKSLVTAGIMGGLGAWFDDMVAGGELVREGGKITNMTDNAIWSMSDMLGVDYETAAGILEGMAGGLIQGEDLEGIIMGAVTNWGGDKINNWVQDYFGNAGVDVDNWFRDGATTIPAEALGGITEAGFRALVAGGMSDADAFDAVMGYFNDGGSLDFIWPEGIDLSWASGLSICPDGSESWYCNIDLPGLPDVNLPDINLPDIPNPCGEGLIWDADLLECIPDINIPNPCGEGTEWDDILQDCVPIQNPCGEGLIWDAKLNECIPDVNVPNPCGEGTEWDEFLQDCVPIENPCGEGLIWDADLGKCIPEIVPPEPCGEGTEWDELLNDCVPIDNPCGPGLIWDADLGECIPDTNVPCPKGWDRDEDGICIEPPTCGEGYSWDPNLGECVPDTNVPCPEGWDRDEDGICIEPPKPCSEGYSWDPDLKECVPDSKPCPEGQERNALGICVDPADPKCPSGSVRDEESGECVKIDGPEIPEVPSINPVSSTGGMFSPQSNEISWETPQYHGPQKATLTPYQSIINSLKTDKGMLS